MFPGKLRFEGNRAIVFEQSDRIPLKEVSRCISLALTHHLGRTRTRRSPKNTSKSE
jgi:hypothetical protein